MNNTHNPTATAANIKSAIVALVRSNLRTKGSLMRLQFIQVYSLNPRYAAMMSSLYWYETRKYAPTVKGNMT
jgi:hypothetical protein